MIEPELYIHCHHFYLVKKKKKSCCRLEVQIKEIMYSVFSDSGWNILGLLEVFLVYFWAVKVFCFGSCFYHSALKAFPTFVIYASWLQSYILRVKF